MSSRERRRQLAQIKIPDAISTTTAMAINCPRCPTIARLVVQCRRTSQFFAWHTSFKLLTHLDEKESQAAEHNDGESDCARYGHPHLHALRGFSVRMIEQNDMGNAKTKS
jgi:hypothetical protein